MKPKTTEEKRQLLEDIKGKMFYLRNLGEMHVTLDEDDLDDLHAYFPDPSYVMVEYHGKFSQVPCDIDDSDEHVALAIFSGYISIMRR